MKDQSSIVEGSEEGSHWTDYTQPEAIEASECSYNHSVDRQTGLVAGKTSSLDNKDGVNCSQRSVKEKQYRTLIQRKRSLETNKRGSLFKRDCSVQNNTSFLLKCGYCSLSFRTKKILIEHLLKHEPHSLESKSSLMSKKPTNNDALKRRMTSVGKRRSKKTFGDDFVTNGWRKKTAGIHLQENSNATQKHCMQQNRRHPEMWERERNQASELNNNKRIMLEYGVQDQYAFGVLESTNTPEIDVGKKLNWEPIRCATCRGCFIKKASFLEHIQRHPSDNPFGCWACSRKFSNYEKCIKHSKVCFRKHKHSCRKCGRVFPSYKSYILHSSDPLRRCVCVRRFQNQSLVSQHTRADHSRSTPTCFHCEQCSKAFQSQPSLRLHQKRHPGAAKPHTCAICDKSFALPKWLSSHVERHSSERRFPCGVCGKTYVTPGDARLHQQRHTKEATFRCDDCGKRFIFISELRAHLRKHQGVGLAKNVQCELCGKSFSSQRDLARHSVVHTGEKPFQCPRCEKRFSQEINMRMHLKIHSGDKAFKCHHCGKAFISKSKLARHAASHSTANGLLDRPFKCLLCPRKYTAENSLTRHLKTHKDSARAVDDVTSALSKALEENGGTGVAPKAGEVLAAMLDQAVEDARRLAKRKKNNTAGKRERPLSDIVDQAIFNTRATSSTQTPIHSAVNEITADLNIRQDGLFPQEPALARKHTDDSVERNALRNELTALNTRADSQNSCNSLETIMSSTQATGSTQTVIVRPTKAVVNPGPTAGQLLPRHSAVCPVHARQGVAAQGYPLHRAISRPQQVQLSIVPAHQFELELRGSDGRSSHSDSLVLPQGITPPGLAGPEPHTLLPQNILPEVSQYIVFQAEPCPTQVAEIPRQPSESALQVLPKLMSSSSSTSRSLDEGAHMSAPQTVDLPPFETKLSRGQFELSSLPEVGAVSGLPPQEVPAGRQESHHNGMTAVVQESPTPSEQHVVLRTAEGQTLLIPSSLLSVDPALSGLLGIGQNVTIADTGELSVCFSS